MEGGGGLKYIVDVTNEIYSRSSLIRPPKGLSQKWSLGEVVVLVKGYFSYYHTLS